MATTLARWLARTLEADVLVIATDVDRALIRELSLLTAKPFIYVFNCDADELADEALKDRMREIIAPAEWTAPAVFNSPHSGRDFRFQ